MATLTHSTVNDVLQIISDLRGESSVNTDASRIRIISRAYQDFSVRKYWRVFKLHDQTTTANGTDRSYAFGSTNYPARPQGKSLCEVFVGGTTEDKRHDIVDFSEYKVRVNNNASDKVAYEWYDAANDAWKMYINPLPASGDTITYSYFWCPPAVTTTAGVIVCPNTDIIALLALKDIYSAEDELQKSQLAAQDADNLITEQFGYENSPAEGQRYSMGAIENSGRNRGIGSY